MTFRLWRCFENRAFLEHRAFFVNVAIFENWAFFRKYGLSARESCAGICASFTNDAYASNARDMRGKYA